MLLIYEDYWWVKLCQNLGHEIGQLFRNIKRDNNSNNNKQTSIFLINFSLFWFFVLLCLRYFCS